jgi:hypothetical protein
VEEAESRLVGEFYQALFTKELQARYFPRYNDSHEPNEPPHGHVGGDDLWAKFCLETENCMRGRRVLFPFTIALAVAAFGPWWLVHEPTSSQAEENLTGEHFFTGWSTSEWKKDIQQWTVVGVIPGDCHWGMPETVWSKKPLPGELTTRDLLAIPRLPLMKGEPEAMAVLLDLLVSRYPKNRLIAAQGLERIGRKAKAAVPRLVDALRDKNPAVRGAVEQALYGIDIEAGRRAGIPWLQ